MPKRKIINVATDASNVDTTTADGVAIIPDVGANVVIIEKPISNTGPANNEHESPMHGGDTQMPQVDEDSENGASSSDDDSDAE